MADGSGSGSYANTELDITPALALVPEANGREDEETGGEVEWLAQPFQVCLEGVLYVMWLVVLESEA
jgi:hypothetical protein